MTKQEENRIKMALYNGATWKEFGDLKVLSFNSHFNTGIKRWDIPDRNITIAHDIPDYYKDYEAVRQFLLRLNEDQQRLYYHKLYLVLSDGQPVAIGAFHFLTASIPQMIKAIIKTLDHGK